MRWQTFYNFFSLILLLGAFQAGRAFELKDFEEEYKRIRDDMAQNWMIWEKGEVK